LRIFQFITQLWDNYAWGNYENISIHHPILIINVRCDGFKLHGTKPDNYICIWMFVPSPLSFARSACRSVWTSELIFPAVLSRGTSAMFFTSDLGRQYLSPVRPNDMHLLLASQSELAVQTWRSFSRTQ